MTLHYITIGAVILLIFILQIKSYLKTRKAMKEYKQLFGGNNTFRYRIKSDERGFVQGFEIEEEQGTNSYFQQIVKSINNYVSNNTTIDFQLIKDTVNTNCDTVEEDIRAQIPIPLYLGLAGTMAGIIIGVGYMWISGSLAQLMSVSPESEGNTEGIVVLFGGVAIAMCCSIVGLCMTTWCTWQLKDCKFKIEQQKSALLSWLQQHLLPEVATNDLQAMNNVAKQLQQFNATFRQNTSDFSAALSTVGTMLNRQKAMAEQMATMSEMAKGMADRNALATNRLSRNVEILERFNESVESVTKYLESVQELIHSQTDQVKKTADQLGNFFTKSNENLQKMLDKANKNLQGELEKQATLSKNAIVNQEKLFSDACNTMKNTITDQLGKLSDTVKGINGVPDKISDLLQKIDKRNKELIEAVRASSVRQVIESRDKDGNKQVIVGGSTMPRWQKWSIAAVAVAIMTFTGMNCYCMWQLSSKTSETNTTLQSIKDASQAPVEQSPKDTTAVHQNP